MDEETYEQLIKSMKPFPEISGKWNSHDIHWKYWRNGVMKEPNELLKSEIIGEYDTTEIAQLYTYDEK